MSDAGYEGGKKCCNPTEPHLELNHVFLMLKASLTKVTEMFCGFILFD